MPGSGGRPTGRPDQEPIDQNGRPDVHKDVHAASPLGRSTERSMDWRQPTLGLPRSTGRSTGQRAVALWFWARSTGQSTDRLNGQFFDRWPVDRKVKTDLSASQQAEFVMGYKYPIWSCFLIKFLRAKILIFSSVLRASFSKEFLCLKDQSSFVV